MKSSAERPRKKLSQSQPARSRPGQSVKTSAEFWEKVSCAAAKIFSSALSDDSSVALNASGFLYSLSDGGSISNAPEQATTSAYLSV